MAFRNLPEMKPTNKPQFAGYGFQFDDGEASSPVQSVNGKTGAVVLNAADVGAATPDDISDAVGDINDNIAPTETTDTASKEYTAGKYFINKDGDLCVVTIDIPEGGTITLNTNCAKATVGYSLYDRRVIDKDVIVGVENLTTISNQYCQKIGRLVSILFRCKFTPSTTGLLTIANITDSKWFLNVSGSIPIQVYNSSRGEIRIGLVTNNGEILYNVESNEVGVVNTAEFNLVYNTSR